jgi:hypothetical protein
MNRVIKKRVRPARPVCLDPYYDEQLEVALDPLPADVSAALD